MNVLIINGSIEYDKLFSSLGYDIVHEMEQANLVCFTGGSDVSPSLYGQQKHAFTHNDTVRDAYECDEFDKAFQLGIPMVGICRGAQFLHVMNGGSMYQHVDGHATGRPHKATDIVTGVEHMVTSTHHQMMANVGIGEVVAVAEEATKLQYMSSVNGDDPISIDSMQDIEVMWHDDTKCLCFQPHPEFNHRIEGAESTYHYFKALLGRYYEVG